MEWAGKNVLIFCDNEGISTKSMNTKQTVNMTNRMPNVRIDASGDNIVCDPFERVIRVNASGDKIVCDPLEEDIRVDASQAAKL